MRLERWSGTLGAEVLVFRWTLPEHDWHELQAVTAHPWNDCYEQLGGQMLDPELQRVLYIPAARLASLHDHQGAAQGISAGKMHALNRKGRLSGLHLAGKVTATA